jgi:hypothetical protein
MNSQHLTVSRIAHIVETSTLLASFIDKMHLSRLAMMTKMPVVSHSPYISFLRYVSPCAGS